MKNRKKMLDLLAHANITQKQAAQMIAEYTRRPCALRTVQAWLNDPDAPSARTCPDWAVDALKNRLAELNAIPAKTR